MDDSDKLRLLKEAVKTDLVPFMAGLGFMRQAKSYAQEPGQKKFGATFSRVRGAYADEIMLMWRTYDRPWFKFEFWTDQSERIIAIDTSHMSRWEREQPWYYVNLHSEPRKPDRWYHTCIWFWFPPLPRWFGERMSVNEAIDRAKARLTELDNYLKFGTPMPPIDLIAKVVVGPHDPSQARPNPPPPPSA